jgi:uroporphyrinogen-III synthase
MRVIVTRPSQEAAAWMDALQAAGHEALQLPLIEVAPPRDSAAVVQAWQRWPTWHAVMFVSAQAVRLFFAQRPVDASALSSWPRCWATGLGTRRALVQAGVPESHIDSPAETSAQFDSETLWCLVSHQVQPGQAVLIVRGSDAGHDASQDGGHDRAHDSPLDTNTQHAADASLADSSGAGRDWLGEQLKAQGAQVQWLAAYERRAPDWSDTQRALAQAAAIDGSVWVFSSSQAIAHLSQLLPQQTWQQARALATHPRIAQAARGLGFGHVATVRPVVSDVIASLESLA